MYNMLDPNKLALPLDTHLFYSKTRYRTCCLFHKFVLIQLCFKGPWRQTPGPPRTCPPAPNPGANWIPACRPSLQTLHYQRDNKSAQQVNTHEICRLRSITCLFSLARSCTVFKTFSQPAGQARLWIFFSVLFAQFRYQLREIFRLALTV